METMQSDNNNASVISRREKWLLTLVAIVVLLLSVMAARYLITNKPKAQRGRPPKAAPAVSVKQLTARDQDVLLKTMGNVVADLEIDLVAESGGLILEIHPEFLPGGFVEKGDVLLRLDPTNYEAVVAQAELALEQARLELRQEEGQQIIAEKEWKLMGMKDISELEKDLVLRKPQIRRAKASIRSAEAALKKAQRDLEKTNIRAPFNAVIRSADVNIGELAAPQKKLATLIGTDIFRVIATIPVDRLPWLQFPSSESDLAGSVTLRTLHGNQREGRLVKLLSDIEPGGRLARVLIHIPDPLDLEQTDIENLPLLLDQYVHLDIRGKTERNVYEVGRQFLHDNDTLYLLADDNTLRIQPVDVVWRDKEVVLLRGDLEGARMIVTDLPGPVQGMPLTPNRGLSMETDPANDSNSLTTGQNGASRI